MIFRRGLCFAALDGSCGASLAYEYRYIYICICLLNDNIYYPCWVNILSSVLQKWGSDHLALACRLAFTKGVQSEDTPNPQPA